MLYEVITGLPAIEADQGLGLVEALQEVALVVEQAHAVERYAQVGDALHVVAGQHAQAARVDGQGLV